MVAYLGCLANLLIGDGLSAYGNFGLVAPMFPSPIDGTRSPFYQCAEMFVPPFFVFSLFTAHWWWGRRAPSVFLDIW